MVRLDVESFISVNSLSDFMCGGPNGAERGSDIDTIAFTDSDRQSIGEAILQKYCQRPGGYLELTVPAA